MLRSRGAGCSGGHPADPWPDSEAPTAWPGSARLGPAVRVRLGAAGPSAAAPLRLREGCGREADNSGS